MLRFFTIFTLCIGLLSACVTTPEDSTSTQYKTNNERATLEAWWTFFNDPVLDRFVSSALNLNYNNEDSKKDLILDIVRKYVEYRYTQSLKSELSKHVNDSNYITEDSASAQLDNVLKEEKELESKSLMLSSDLTALTKLLPEYVSQVLKEEKTIPVSDVTPILASEASILSKSIKVLAARSSFVKSSRSTTSLSKTGEVFPVMTISRFFGVSDDVYLNNNQKWSISSGSGIKNLDLLELNELYKNNNSYDKFLDNIYSAISDIERKIISFANMEEQHIVLKGAAEKYQKECSTLKGYKSRNISSASASKVCDEAYSSKLASLRAEYEKSKILIDIYEILAFMP